MKRQRTWLAVLAAVLTTGALLVGSEGGATARPETHGRTIHARFRGVTPPLRQLAAAAAHAGPTPTPPGAPLAARSPELPSGGHDEGEEDTRAPSDIPVPRAQSLPVKQSGNAVKRFWNGSDHYDSRYSGFGNQFSAEPPDQGVCAGVGYVLEIVNSVVQVTNMRGEPLLGGDPLYPQGGPVGLSLNEFYGYAPGFVRPDGPFGPDLYDVMCLYDASSGRWFALSDHDNLDPTTGDYGGQSGLDLAVSATSDPLGPWYLTFIDTQNNGQDGTPNHGCPSGFCFGDFPHMGINADGVYITTNEFDALGPSFNGAQLYALSKFDLVRGTPSPVTMFENLQFEGLDLEAATVQPAVSRPDSFDTSMGGIEYFVAGTNTDSVAENRVAVFALTNTASLNTAVGSSALDLQQVLVRTIAYHDTPLSLQRSGPTPFLQCANVGKACLGAPPPFQQRGPYPLEGIDARVQEVSADHGVLWAVMGTALKGRGGSSWSKKNHYAPTPIGRKAGVAYFALRPTWAGGTLGATVVRQGYIGIDGNNLTFPSIATAGRGSAYIGVSIVGPDFYPSAGFVKVSLDKAPTAVRMIGEGIGPSDGFSGTWFGDFRPRWGDYGYAFPSSNGSVWIAGEWIANRCTYPRFFVDSTCGFQRSFLANWDTFVAKLT